MSSKYILKIINEEINNFDYLGNDAQQKEDELLNLLKTEEFQKQFICDILLRKNNIKRKVDYANIGGDYEENEPSYLTLEYFIDFEYQYDINKEPIKFTIDFDGNSIGVSVHTTDDAGSYHTQPHSESHYSDIEWHDINVTMHTIDGDEIDFIAFKKAPIKIQELFIRENVEGFISNETFNTSELNKEKIQNIPYC